MIGWPAGVRIWLVAGVIDMREGMDTLCALVQSALADNPFSGQLFIFRGRRGDKVRCCGMSPTVYGCIASGWTEATSSDHKFPTAPCC